MGSWQDFARAAPGFAAAGERLLSGDDGVAIAYLATVSPRGVPHLSPVCPIFRPPGLYLSAATHTPKARDLREGGRYALHAFLGPNDEEFQVRGRARETTDPEERAAVHAAIRFGAFDRAHPIFRFDIESALWVFWERPGQPDTRAVRRRWPA